jgi:hypothetical protein
MNEIAGSSKGRDRRRLVGTLPVMRLSLGVSHDAYEETIYGLAGVLTFTVAGRKTEHQAGGSALHPSRSCPSRIFWELYGII